VFGVALPDSLEQREGQLALGGSPHELGLDLKPFQYVEPRAGRLVIFPSTLWHATEPFRSGERMTISFDLARPFEES
jgi:Putative 2OG-Fe(II) oxygenase